MSGRRAVVSLLAVILWSSAAGFALASPVTIQAPGDDQKYEDETAQVSTSGIATQGTAFVVEIIDENGVVISNASVTPTPDGPNQWTWGADLPRPGDEWPIGTYTLHAVRNGIVVSNTLSVIFVEAPGESP